MTEQNAAVRELDLHAEELGELVRKAGAAVVGVQLEQALGQVRDFAENRAVRIAESLTTLAAPGITLTDEEREQLNERQGAGTHVAQKLLEQLNTKPEDVRSGTVWRDAKSSVEALDQLAAGQS